MSFFPHLPLVVAAAVLVVLTAVLLVAGLRSRDQRSTAEHRHLVRRRWRHLCLALLLVGVAARPTVGSTLTTTYTAGADVVIMIDRTTSMGALDYQGTKPRMDGVRHDLTTILRDLNGSRFAVIVFDNNARIALPFTTDASAVASLADTIDWRSAEYGDGSDLGIGVPLAQQLLQQSHQQHPEVDRFLFYLGDGEQTKKSAASTFESLTPLVNRAVVLGYGTTTGARMRPTTQSKDFVMHRGSPAISRADPAALQKIAEQLRGSHLQRTSPAGFSVQVDNPTLIPTVHRDPRGRETYWWLALGAAAVLLWELWETVAGYRQFRRQWS